MFVEGMVHVSSLPRDYYNYVEKQHALVAERTHQVFRIGDRVRVRVANVSLEKKQIDFAWVKTSLDVAEYSESEEYPRIPVKGKRPERAKGPGGKRKSKGSGGRRREK
jgi:ribonuclease R